MARRLKPSPAMVVALIALFVSIGGVGYAASKIGTDDIKNGAVTTKKLHKAAVKTKKIHNNAVKTNKIADDAVTGAKVLDDSLTGNDIDESTLGTVPNADQLGGIAASGYAQRMFARVSYNDPNPSIIVSSPGISTNGEGALGFPRVVFPQSVDNCAVVASASSNAGTQIVRRSQGASGTQVQFAIKDQNGAQVRSNFDLIVIC
jgi:hypothetical protein